MKYIALKIRNKTHRVSEKDILRIHVHLPKARPSLPLFREEEFNKVLSPTVTDIGDEFFFNNRQEAFLI